MEIKHLRRAAALGAAMALAAPAAASAHTVYPTQGTTSLKLSPGAKAALGQLGIKAQGVRYPIVGGAYSFHTLDEGGGGVLRHGGALTLTRRGKTVRLAQFAFKVKAEAHHSHNEKGEEHEHGSGTLSAKVAGKRLTVAKLDLDRYEPAEDDPGFRGAKAMLSARAASALNAAFGTSAFAAGLPLGTLSAKGVAQPLRFTGGATRVSLASKAVSAIAGTGASIAPLPGTAGAGSAGDPFVFPVTGDRFDYVSFKGAFTHSGGLRYTPPAGKTVGGAASLDIADLYVAYGKELTAKIGGKDGTPVFRLLFAKKSELKAKPAVELTNLDVYLTKQAAGLLSPSLGISTGDLRKLKLGTASVRAAYQKG